MIRKRLPDSLSRRFCTGDYSHRITLALEFALEFNRVGEGEAQCRQSRVAVAWSHNDCAACFLLECVLVGLSEWSPLRSPRRHALLA